MKKSDPAPSYKFGLLMALGVAGISLLASWASHSAFSKILFAMTAGMLIVVAHNIYRLARVRGFNYKPDA